MEKKRKETELAASGGILPFSQWFFPEREGMALLVGPHHRVLSQTLDRVIKREISRLIITLPPGYTKTEFAVVNFIAKGFQVNPKARFIHSTFSDDLARENSDKVKTLIELDEFQELANVSIRTDSKAKDRWKTEQGGGLLAKAAGGPITGFRAGYMDKTTFTGALVVDDPLKPDDAFSPKKREIVNRRATNTFRSRLAHEGVPIIVIMQRLHSDDFAGYLLKGGTGDYWHHLDLPILIEPGMEYPKEWTHGVPVEHGLPSGPLWAEKHSEDEIEILKADAYTYNSQYRQRPQSIEGALFDMDGFQEWHELPPMDATWIYVDTAQKTEERNDYSVFQLWGQAASGQIYLIDQIRGKWKAPLLEAMARTFWAKCLSGGWKPRGMKIEDKVSGTGLIQSLSLPQPGKKLIPVKGIPRNKDKYTCGLDAAPWIATKHVYLPAKAKWKASLVTELASFDGLGTGHDDQVDPLMDAIADLLNGGSYSLKGAL